MRTVRTMCVAIRKRKARTIDELKNGVDIAFKEISDSDCIGWFNSCKTC